VYSNPCFLLNIFYLFKVSLEIVFYSLEAHCFWLGIICYFFGSPESKVAWTRPGSNPGPSDSLPDAMAICYDDPMLTDSNFATKFLRIQTKNKAAYSRIILLIKKHVFMCSVAVYDKKDGINMCKTSYTRV